MQASFLKEEV